MGSPWLWLMPSPRLMPTPTTATTAWATTVLATDLDTVATDTDTVLATTTDTTARGPLTPSPPPLLRPRLMLSLLRVLRPGLPRSWIPRLRIRSWPLRLRPRSVRILRISVQPTPVSLGITSSSSEKWIAQFGLIPTSATSFSATRLAQQARNGEQEAKENQNVMIRRIKKS